jgi:hypothetical protein
MINVTHGALPNGQAGGLCDEPGASGWARSGEEAATMADARPQTAAPDTDEGRGRFHHTMGCSPHRVWPFGPKQFREEYLTTQP